MEGVRENGGRKEDPVLGDCCVSLQNHRVLSVQCCYFLSVCSPVQNYLICGTFQAVSLASLGGVWGWCLRTRRDSFLKLGRTNSAFGRVRMPSWERALSGGTMWVLCAAELSKLLHVPWQAVLKSVGCLLRNMGLVLCLHRENSKQLCFLQTVVMAQWCYTGGCLCSIFPRKNRTLVAHDGECLCVCSK